MTQRERVLRALRCAGERGITARDLYAVPVDGGPRISRVAARILELRDAGFDIDASGERDGHAVYVLHEHPDYRTGWCCIHCAARYADPPPPGCPACGAPVVRLVVADVARQAVAA